MYGLPEKKSPEKITEKKSDYVFSLKGNQEKIHDDVKEFFTSHELDEKYCERYKIQKYEGELEIGHGRIEKREGFLCTNIKWLEGKESVNFRKTNAFVCARHVYRLEEGRTFSKKAIVKAGQQDRFERGERKRVQYLLRSTAELA